MIIAGESCSIRTILSENLCASDAHQFHDLVCFQPTKRFDVNFPQIVSCDVGNLLYVCH